MRPSFGDQIGGRGLEQVRGGVEHLLAQGLGREPRGAAGEHRAAARIGAGPARHRGAVALQHAHVLDAAAEMLGDHLRERGLQSLPVRRDAECRRDGAGRVDADGRCLGAGVDRHAGRDRDARADAGQLGVARDADAEPFARCARFGLLAAQGFVFDLLGTRPRDLRRNPTCPTRCRSRSCAETPSGGTRLRRRISFGSRPSLRGRHVDQALHHEGRDRPPDAAIRPGRRLAGRDRLHAAAIVLDPIGAGQEAHDLHRLERRGPRIDRIGADVADHVGAQRQHLAVARRAPARHRRSRRTPGWWRKGPPCGRWSI